MPDIVWLGVKHVVASLQRRDCFHRLSWLDARKTQTIDNVRAFKTIHSHCDLFLRRRDRLALFTRQHAVAGNRHISRAFEGLTFLEAHQHVAGNTLGPEAFLTWALLNWGRNRTNCTGAGREGDQRHNKAQKAATEKDHLR